MGSAFVFVLVVLIAFAIVTVGAVAYELTGLDRDTARFQALSAFTLAGFTTRASERVVEHPLRRRITIVLMLLGYAGAASVIATLVHSVEVGSLLDQLENILIIGLMGGFAWLLIWRFGARAWLGDVTRRVLARRMGRERVPHEDLMYYKQGFGITRIEVPASSPVIGKSLRELDLRASQLQVLAIEDHGDVDAIPSADHVVQPRQHLVLYGRLANVNGVFAPAPGGAGQPTA